MQGLKQGSRNKMEDKKNAHHYKWKHWEAHAELTVPWKGCICVYWCCNRYGNVKRWVKVRLQRWCDDISSIEIIKDTPDKIKLFKNVWRQRQNWSVLFSFCCSWYFLDRCIKDDFYCWHLSQQNMRQRLAPILSLSDQRLIILLIDMQDPRMKRCAALTVHTLTRVQAWLYQLRAWIASFGSN